MLFVTSEGLLDVELLKLTHRFVQQDVAFEHFVNEAFESGMNQSTFPVSNL
jgi:hypothetical protein